MRREHLSFKRLKGYFDPEGNNGAGSATVPLEVPDCNGCLSGFEEFPALPDLTMPFLEGIQLVVGCQKYNYVERQLGPIYLDEMISPFFSTDLLCGWLDENRNRG